MAQRLSSLRRRTSSGFTLVEIVIGMAILGLLATPLASTISLVLAQRPAQGNKLAIENEQGLARYWITRDATSARTFTARTSPQYGTFTWTDFYGPTGVTYEVTYYYDPLLKALMREEKLNGATQDTFYVADNIQQESDVVVGWSPAQRKVTMTITPTIQDAPAVGDATRTATLVAFLRPVAETVVSPPGSVPAPPPQPGSEIYYVAANPSMVTGNYVSGNATSLHDADTNYYVVASVTLGVSKTVIWTAYSQALSAPATINQIQVLFSGLSSNSSVSMQFFVARATGYPTLSDSGFTFTDADTENTHSFFLDAATVSYINTTRTIFLKVQANASPTFTLSANQVLFIASP